MNQRPFFQSLRGKTIWQMLLISILPIIIVGGLTYYSLSQAVQSASTGLQNSYSQLERDVVGANITSAAQTIADEIDQYMLERMSDTLVWASTPNVLEIARDGYKLAEEMGLPTMTKDDIEAKMAATRRLDLGLTGNNYLLQQIKISPHFGEIFFTDAHGYNVAMTGLTSDFVQSDEGWWQGGWEEGINVGDVEYDDSAGIWSMDLSPRITDAQTGERLGVMKAVLGVSLIQEVADRYTLRIKNGTVTVITADGLLLAETETGHDLARIMNPEVTLLDSGVEAVTQALGSVDAKGYTVENGMVIGYVRTAGPSFYQNIPGFDGFDWIVLVQQPEEIAFASLDSLRVLEDDLDASRRTVGITIVATMVVMALLSALMAFTFARSITGPLSHFVNAAEKVSLGDLDVQISVDTQDEIGDLANAFKRLVAAVRVYMAEEKE